jgi:type I restriction enzyme S subunit
MIDDLKPYPEYKDSGLPWLGKVPESWGIALNQRIFKEKVRSHEGREETQLSLSQRDGLIATSEMQERSLQTSTYENWKLTLPGDLVLNRFKAHLGVFFAATLRGIVSFHYGVFMPRVNLVTKYYELLFHTVPYRTIYAGQSNGMTVGLQNLSNQNFYNVKSIVPPHDEQAAIVCFLDHANGKIERAIRVKRKLIALLNEQKQAIIHRAVTHGLDPNVKLKPSGIPWLGDIPEHWGISRLKFEASKIVDCLHATPRYSTDGEYPAIRTADIEPGKVRLWQVRKVSKNEYERWISRLAPQKDDILYSREGERYGIAALVPGNVQLCISQRMMVFRIKQTQCAEFIMWQLNSAHVLAQARGDSIGATAPHVNVERIRNYQIAIPPLQEQMAISNEIRSCTEVLDVSIDRIEREIALLREYRTSLSAEVVTGKLDVRAAATKLPELTPCTPEPATYGSADELEAEE